MERQCHKSQGLTWLGTCAQVSAGNQLFHILVDNDDIAARLSTMLKQEKAGRVTFIPLNQVYFGHQ